MQGGVPVERLVSLRLTLVLIMYGADGILRND